MSAPAPLAIPPLVDIIIPGYENMPLTRRLLQSMRQTQGVPINVIYVDNGSHPYDVGQLIQDYPGLVIVRLNQNYGFVRAMNAGMAQAFLSPAPFVLWLNNDVEVPKNDPTWLKRLIEPFQDEKVAATGAVSNNVFGQQRYEQAGQDLQEVAVLIGFALCVRKTCAQAVGFLDEKFGIGNYEDWDYSLRLRVRGWKLIAVESVFLLHKLHQTFGRINVDLDALLRHNLDYLAQKWGVEKLASLGIELREAAPEPELAPSDGAFGISTADGFTDAQLAESHHAHEFHQSQAEPATRLVTHSTVNWLPKVEPYMDSLKANSPWENWLIVVNLQRATESGVRVIDGIKSKQVADQPGAPERTASLQHGAFLPFVAGHPDDVLIYTDGYIIMQRPPTEPERDLFEKLPPGVALAGYNSGPYETLGLEAARLSPRFDPGTVFDARIMGQPCYNIGVIAARRADWERIHAAYMHYYDAALALFNHPARQQWLVCYVMAELGIQVRVLPYTVHMHGCYPLPEGGTWDGQTAAFDKEPVLFRHHIA